MADAKAGKPVDWTAMRLANADRKDFLLNAVNLDDKSYELNVLYGVYVSLKIMGVDTSGQQSSLIAKAKAILNKDFTNQSAHSVLSSIYRDKKDDDKSKYHRDIKTNLLLSIISPDEFNEEKIKIADSFENSYIVISEDEEAEVVRFFRSDPENKKRYIKDGHTYESFLIKYKGELKRIYFLVDCLVAAEKAAPRKGK